MISALLVVVVGCASGGQAGGSGEDYPSDTVQIMVPADPGGGYDQLGRAVAKTLQEEVIDQDVEVYNVPGASGTTGLTQFVSDNAGDPNQLLVMGSILVGAVKTTDAPVSLEDTTPIAELYSEYDAIVVPADSEYKNLKQLVDAFKENPKSISWGGGSTGGVDQVLVGQLAEEVGVDPAQVNYVPYSGGGELTPALLSGDVKAGVSGLNEFTDLIDSGKLRLLAVSSEKPIKGVDAPTLVEEGYDVSISNWRGLVGPPELSEEQQQDVVGMIEKMHDTPQWQKYLKSNNYVDSFKTGDEFGRYIKSEDERITKVLRQLGLVKQ
jgi:putative tricarboxylic transport membrane protein